MRKTKANLSHPPVSDESEVRENEETENDERYEAINGETSSEGVGRGFDAEGADATALEKDEATADGPLSGEETDPPRSGRVRVKRKGKKGRAVTPPHGRSNHRAAFSSKTI